MTNRPVPLRTCRHCGAQWSNAGVGRGGSHRLRYCSAACRDAARRNSNKSNGGAIPVGRRFWRSHDGAECVVLADAKGLPFAEALREMEAQS